MWAKADTKKNINYSKNIIVLTLQSDDLHQKYEITKKGHKQERKRFLAKSKGCRDEDAMPLVHNVNQQEDNIEQ